MALTILAKCSIHGFIKLKKSEVHGISLRLLHNQNLEFRLKFYGCYTLYLVGQVCSHNPVQDRYKIDPDS